MQLRSLAIAAALASSTTLAGAQQDVRVEVVDAVNGKPIVGANVSVYDSAGVVPFGGTFSDQAGRTDLRPPIRGPFRIKADKVGYDSWTSVQLHPGGKAMYLRVGMAVTRSPLPMIVRSETSCQQLTGPGTAVGDLWTELKKALTAAAVTDAQGLVPLDVDVYERVLDRDYGVVSERAEQRPRVARRPVMGISWDQMDTSRRGDAGGHEVYRAPEAATLVSEQFIRTHCYAAIKGYGPEVGLTGLEFRPAHVAGLPELAGVLWLDPKDNSLRAVNFDYLNLPIPLRVARTTGRVEFEQLPGGQWIVPRWYIRMPRVARVAGNSQTPARDSLIGYQEVGGAARPAGSRPLRTASNVSPRDTDDAEEDSNGPSVVGVVYDSTLGRPLPQVKVSTGGGKYRALTGAGGQYEMAVAGPLNDSIVFEHPRLRMFHIADAVQPISVPAAGHAQASIIIPSYNTLRAQLCGRNETGTESQGFMAGYVRDPYGKPIPRAHVWATWQILWVEQNGRLVSTNQQRTVETDTNSDGSYVMCGFTRGAQVLAKVSIAGKPTVQERVMLPPAMVLEKDFVLGGIASRQ